MSFSSFVRHASAFGLLGKKLSRAEILRAEAVKPAFSRCVGGNFIPPNPADAACYAQAIALPGKFDAVRIGFVQSGGGAVTGMTAAVAATDDVGDRSNTNTPAGRRFVTPYRGGIEKNEYSLNGWTRLTVSGAPSWGILDPGSDLINVAWSDLAEVHGIEDSVHPGWYPLLVRYFGGTNTFTRPGLSGFVDPTKFLAESGPAYMLGCYRPTAADAVSNLGTWSNSNNATFSDAAVLAIVVEAYQGGSRAKTILMTGDSRFSIAEPGTEETNNGYRSLCWKMENSLRALGKNAVLTRCARGARTSLTYSLWAESLLMQINPDVSAYLCYSANDGTPTELSLSSARTRVLQHLISCKRVGAVPLLVSIFPYGLPGSTGYLNLAAVRNFDSWIKSLGVPYFSPLSVYGETNGSWVPGYAFDANHMTSSGYTDMGEKMALVAAAYL